MEALLIFSAIVLCVIVIFIVTFNYVAIKNMKDIYNHLDQLTAGDKILCNNAWTEAVRRHGNNLTLEQAVAVLEEMQIRGKRSF